MRYFVPIVVQDELTDEQKEILQHFAQLLLGPTGDGRRKREAGTKPLWKKDEHRPSMYRHLDRWEAGERHDPDSGAHPLVGTAWRALAIAWQETRETAT